MPALNAQPAVVKLYTVNDGLPSTETGAACQDKYGYLWVSTTGGFSRFDGRQFVNYSLADGLPALNGNYIFQDSHERLWLGTGAGISQFKNSRFITYPTNDSLNIHYVSNFTETKDKQLWAFTDKGVYKFNDSVWEKQILYPRFRSNSCINMIETNGELYVIYREDILCRTKDAKWIHIAFIHDGSILNSVTTKDNQIYVGTGKNIYEVRNHRLITLYESNKAESNFFSSFLVDSKKRLWLAGNDYLKISIPGDFRHFPDSIRNQYGYIFSIKEDSSGNVWLGSRKGLVKIKNIAYTVVDKDEIPSDGLFNIIPLPDNRLIFSYGTKSGLLVYQDSYCRQIMPPPLPGNKNYYNDPVDAYTFDEKNSLWMITRFRKFLHFNGNILEDFSSALHLSTLEYIYDVAYIKNRHQFFICADSTLLYGSSLKLTTFIPNNTSIPIMKPTRVHEIANGLVLLFIEGKGLYCIDAANNLISLTDGANFNYPGNGLQSAVCFSNETNDNFWMSIPGFGLYEYGFSKNKLPFLKNYFTVKNGLQSNNILSLTNDRQNRLWVVTSKGLDILQLNYLGKWEVFNYATTDELTFNGSYYEKLITDAVGNVWLSSPNKILKFNSANIKLHKEPPRMIIEKVSLSFKETDWSKSTDSLYSYYQLPYNPVLKYNQNSLSIFFNAIDLFTTNSYPEYSYKLLPLDTSWSIPFNTKSVSFAQLPAGKYRFIVRAKDMASGWSQPAVFFFTITPSFWNRWWFRIIIIVIAASVIISIFRARIKKIRQDSFIENQLKELEMKALKAQMNPHFIYNALNSIQALIANDKKAEGIHYIGSFSRLLRQVLDNSENNVISLDKELETIGFYIQLESLRLDLKLQYKKIIPENIVAEFEKIPPLILQPFVENALWHGLSNKEGEKEIKIRVSTMNEWLVCDITDNGIGRVKAEELKKNSRLIHQSKAIDITRKRLIDFNEDDLFPPIEFFDLYDDKKNSIGTSVTVRIKRKFSSASNSFNKSNT